MYVTQFYACAKDAFVTGCRKLPLWFWERKAEAEAPSDKMATFNLNSVEAL